MAQRTIHYVFGELLLRECPVRDRQRFLLGSILPDAYADRSDREATHLMDHSRTGWSVFDFDAFRERFGAEMAADDLYLGYYMHLVEDNFYRRFFRERLGVAIDAQNAEQIAVLHRDYTLLNAYIVSHFGIKNELTRPADFEREPICALATFDLDGFLAKFDADFSETAQGRTHYLTEAMLEDYLALYRGDCLRELRTVQAGGRWLRAADMAWTNERE